MHHVTVNSESVPHVDVSDNREQRDFYVTESRQTCRTDVLH